MAAAKAAGLDQTLAGPGPYTVFVPDDAAFGRAPAGTFDAAPGNRAQLTGILTNLILPGTVLVADIDKAIDAGKGKAVLATMGGGTLTATKDGDKIVITDAAGHKATITKGDEQFTNGVVHHVDARADAGQAAGGERRRRPESRLELDVATCRYIARIIPLPRAKRLAIVEPRRVRMMGLDSDESDD